MKITIDIPKSKIKQYIYTVMSATGAECPEEKIDRIADTAEIDITDECATDKEYSQIPLALGCIAVGLLLEKDESPRDGNNS